MSIVNVKTMIIHGIDEVKEASLFLLVALVLFSLFVLSNVSVVYSVEEYSFVRNFGSLCEFSGYAYGCIIDRRGDVQIVFPTGIAVDSSGNVYIIDSWNDRIQKFTADGKFITKWGSDGYGDGEFKWPIAIAIDPSDNVYISDYATSRIQKFTADGKFITKWGSDGYGDGEFLVPIAIAIDPSGNNVYVVDQNNYRIQKFTADGKFITKWGSFGEDDEKFSNPKGIAIDPSGNVYVVDQNNNRIQKFTADGKFITKWGSRCSSTFKIALIVDGACPNPADGKFWYPDGGIAIDPSGNVYVVDQNNYRIQKFTADGKFITKWGSKGSDNGQFNSPLEGPSGIAIDSKIGNVYVTIGNDRIQVFAPASAQLSAN
jgi:DNA-binding beta-propeller fold protein YncE